MTKTFRFYKTSSNDWYIDLPGWTGSIEELAMVQGADSMLDTVSGNTDECYLKISDEPFENAAILELIVPRTETYGGGGDYILEKYESETINHKMWLCEVTRHVFNALPAKIYFKKTTGV
ncbi:MAG: hypothetical protein JWQ28_754 [Pedobacter sp.]|nr:hypothetical protein [Pedobacter sp.]